jgi:hypothetical protein
VLTPDQKGAIAETAIIAQAVRLGIEVYKPFNDGLRWDLVFGANGTFLRVQSKWAVRRGDVVVVTLRSCRRARDGYIRRTYSTDEIDLVAAYCDEVDGCYLIPPELFAGHPTAWLRLEPAKNNQRLGINWAADYEFAATLRQHLDGAIAQLGERLTGSQKGAGSSPAGSTSKAASGGLQLFRS